METIKNFTIKRSNWLRGHPMLSCLLNAQNKMCCLGFLAKKCDANDDDIMYKSNPASVPHLNWPVGIFNNSISLMHSSDTHLILEINDNPSISDSEREEKLILAFSKIGITVTFED